MTFARSFARRLTFSMISNFFRAIQVLSIPKRRFESAAPCNDARALSRHPKKKFGIFERSTCRRTLSRTIAISFSPVLKLRDASSMQHKAAVFGRSKYFQYIYFHWNNIFFVHNKKNMSIYIAGEKSI